MKLIAHLDCSTGVSGDKFLGALLDIGEATGQFTAEQLAATIATLAPEARLAVERVRSRGIAAVSVRVEAPGASTAAPPHRTWATIRAMLEGAALPAPVRARALTAFGELALAEARVHGVVADDVHFHEVGALDSIADIVGVSAGIEALGIESISASVVAVGSGTIETSHGTLSVPAPATAELLTGVPTVHGPQLSGAPEPGGARAAGELTTPTGAALLRACVSSYGTWPPMTPLASGYGAGTRDIGVPNVCRIVLGRPAPQPEALAEEAVTLLETNLDHLSPEAVAVAAEQLLGEGALDVWTSPIVMKKGRSALILSLLVSPERVETFAERVVALTGTLGVRRRDFTRLVAPRECLVLETDYGPVRFKRGGGRLRPEADEVARIAAAEGRSYSDVEHELEREHD